MPMNYYDTAELQPGANRYESGGDPFAYTAGSLLTPWEGRFKSNFDPVANSGGAVAPKFSTLKFGDLNYKAPDVGQFGEVYNDPAAFAETYNNPAAYAEYQAPAAFGETWQDPAAFRFADFVGPNDFRAPTQEDMRVDPGYQVRMDAVKNAQMAGAAHSGVLRSGGFQKGLAKAIGDQASSEYGNVYGRRAAEHDRNRAEAVSNYGINQGNTFQAFNTNNANRLTGYQTRRQGYDTDTAQGLAAYQTKRAARDTDVAQQLAGYQTRRGAYESDIQNKLAGYQTRQGAWQGNANTALAQGELGWNVASGSWDRNYAKASAANDLKNRQAAANAAAASSNRSSRNAASREQYQMDLGDYTRARDEFYTNQDRQYGILDREATRGERNADRMAGYISQGYGAMGDYAMGSANAGAAGTAARSQAYGDYAGNMGNMIGQSAAAGYLYGK
jgi:hypothetical protein